MSDRRARRRAVTLLEVVLSVSLLVLLSSMTFWFYSSLLHTREKGLARSYQLRLVRAVMDQLAGEIRQASAITADQRVGIRGMEEKLWLSSYRLPSREVSKVRDKRTPPPGEYDITKVQYSIARHPEILDPAGGWEMPLGLARTEVQIPRPRAPISGDQTDPLRQTVSDNSKDAAPDESEQAFLDQVKSKKRGKPGGRIGRDANIQWEEIYAPEIRYLRLCYYDGNKWWDTWDVVGENPLPQLVMVTMGFEPHPPFEGVQGRDRPNEEFCTCLNREPPDCEPLPDDEFTEIVRVGQADPLFRSRVTRETQSIVDQLNGGNEQGDQETGTGEAQP